MSSLAVLVKLWPACFALLGLGAWRSGRGRRYTVAAAVVGAGGLAAWLAADGIAGVQQVLTYKHAHGWEIETIPGLALLARNPDAQFSSSGALRIGSISGNVHVGLTVLSLALAAWAVLRSDRVGRIGLGWIVAVTSLLVFAPLLSPQFILWLLPGAAIAWTQGDRLISGLALVTAPLTGIEMTRWEWLVDGRPIWIALVAVRNALLVAAMIGGIGVLRRARRPVLEPS